MNTDTPETRRARLRGAPWPTSRLAPPPFPHRRSWTDLLVPAILLALAMMAGVSFVALLKAGMNRPHAASTSGAP